MACAAQGARDARRAADAAAGRDWTARGARRLRGQPQSRTPVAPLDMAEVVKTLAAPRARRHDLHQRRRQLQRLAASLLPLPGLQHARPHAARADLGRDGLRRAGRGRRGAAGAAAHRRQHRRRRRLPDDRPGARDRHRLRRRQRGCVSIVVDNGTYGTIRMHQEREYPGRVSGSDLFNPDFAALARAYGWRAGERVDTHRRLRAGAAGGARRGTADADPSAARRRRDHQPDDAAGDPRLGRAARCRQA